MPQYKYAFQKFNKELMARAIGRDVPISTKQSIEICNYLRHRKVGQAKMLLEGVTLKKQAVPFKRFNDGVGHRPGKMAAGRYPVKASRAILKLIESAEANAQTKGLNTGELEIIHICAHQAHRPVHYGRHSGREFKRTHVEVVLQETVGKNDKKQGKKPNKEKQENKEAPVKKDVPVKKEAKEAVNKEVKAEEKKTTKTTPTAEKPVKKADTATKQEDKK